MGVEEEEEGKDERTLLALVVLESLKTAKRSGTGSELVGELALVLVFVVHLSVSLLRFAWKGLAIAWGRMGKEQVEEKHTPAPSHCEL